jgi:hypothetical protein
VSNAGEWVDIAASNDSAGRVSLRIGARWTSQDIAGNRSFVEVVVYVMRAMAGFFNNYDTGWSVAGSQGNAAGNWRTGNNGWTRVDLYTWSGWIGHDSAGNGSYQCSASLAAKAPMAAVSVGGTLGLPRIPRTSSADVADFEFGGSTTVTIHKASASFNHRVEVFANGGTWALLARVDTSGASASLSVPLDQAATYCANNGWLAIVFRITTYDAAWNGIGFVDYYKGLYVPASVVPTCGLTLARQDVGTPPAWGLWVVGHSKAKASMTASGAVGSTITRWQLTGPDFTYNGSGAPNSQTTDLLRSAGTHKATLTVWDSRGRTAAASASLTAVAWTPPVVTPGVAERTDPAGVADYQGQWATLSFAETIATVSGKNTVTNRAMRYRKRGSTSWKTIATPTPNHQLTIGGDLDPTSFYEIELTITDALAGQATTTWTVAAAQVSIHLPAGGKHVGLLRAVSDDEALDHPLAVVAGGDLLVDGAITQQGRPVVTCTSNGVWHEEDLGGGLYRWTQVVDLSVATTSAIGSVYYGGAPALALPPGASVSSWFVAWRQMAYSSSICWAVSQPIPDDTGAPRLSVWVVSTGSGTRAGQICYTVYGTK